MQDPELYIKANAIQRRDAMEMMSTYMELVQWRGTADETVLDVGCGSGDVTWEFLKPRLPTSARLSGADIAPNMISYAAKNYPDIDFFLLDIGTKNLQNCWSNAFDHIFSFYCLHWVQDKRQVMHNIYTMLKPGGDLFAYFIGSHIFFDVFFNSSQLIKWKHYISEEDAQRYTNIHQNECPMYMENRINAILFDAGFKISVCNVLNRDFEYSNLEEIKVEFRAIHPHYEKIPKKLREEFIDDSLQELLKLKCVQEKNIYENFKKIVIPYNLVVIVATKAL